MYAFVSFLIVILRSSYTISRPLEILVFSHEPNSKLKQLKNLEYKSKNTS